MNARLEALCHAAQKNGYSIHENNETVEITKTVGRWHKRQGIVIYPDGTAFDVTVDLSAAKGLRSYDDMRSVLELPSEQDEKSINAFNREARKFWGPHSPR